MDKNGGKDWSPVKTMLKDYNVDKLKVAETLCGEDIDSEGFVGGDEVTETIIEHFNTENPDTGKEAANYLLVDIKRPFKETPLNSMDFESGEKYEVFMAFRVGKKGAINSNIKSKKGEPVFDNLYINKLVPKDLKALEKTNFTEMTAMKLNLMSSMMVLITGVLYAY